MRACLVLAVLTLDVAAAAAQADPGPVTQPDPSPRETPPVVINIINHGPATPVPVEPEVGAPPTLAARYERRHPRAPRRWLTLGAAVGRGGERGLRASLDLLALGPLTLGVAGTLAAPAGGMDGPSGARDGATDAGSPSGDAIAYLAWTTSLGPLALRAQVGAGASFGARADQAAAARDAMATDRPTPHGEAALLFGLPITRHLALLAGPIASGDLSRGSQQVELKGFGGLGLRF